MRRIRSSASGSARRPRAFRGAEPVDFPFPDPDENKLFMREVADVHRGLYPEYADDYGEAIRWKLELCAAVTDGEVETAERLRAEYRERCEEVFDGLDLLVTPTMAGVAPPGDRRRTRAAGPRHPAHLPIQLPRLARPRDPVWPGGGRPTRIRAARGASG